MYTYQHKSIVRILQDIKTKSNLAYKYSDELIGFVDLENVRNELLE